MNNNLKKIFEELEDKSQFISNKEVINLAHKIASSQHIFLAGAGRSRAVVQAFGNRLMHLGLSVSIVGDISSPHTKKGDLLVVCSGSGETSSLKEICKKAKDNQVEVAVVTTNSNSSIAALADVILEIKSATKIKQENSIQPMGSTFEQLAFLTFDAIVLELMNELGETSITMVARHANLE